MASKFYAVKRGKIKGIFYTWADCKQMVDGYPNPVYKSFPTVEEADAFIRGEKVSADAATAEKSGSTQTDTDKTEGGTVRRGKQLCICGRFFQRSDKSIWLRWLFDLW